MGDGEGGGRAVKVDHPTQIFLSEFFLKMRLLMSIYFWITQFRLILDLSHVLSHFLILNNRITHFSKKSSTKVDGPDVWKLTVKNAEMVGPNTSKSEDRRSESMKDGLRLQKWTVSKF